MEDPFNSVVEQDADGWLVASIPALAGCHTQARSFDELNERILEAIALSRGDGCQQ